MIIIEPHLAPYFCCPTTQLLKHDYTYCTLTQYESSQFKSTQQKDHHELKPQHTLTMRQKLNVRTRTTKAHYDGTIFFLTISTCVLQYPQSPT